MIHKNPGMDRSSSGSQQGSSLPARSLRATLALLVMALATWSSSHEPKMAACSNPSDLILAVRTIHQVPGKSRLLSWLMERQYLASQKSNSRPDFGIQLGQAEVAIVLPEDRSRPVSGKSRRGKLAQSSDANAGSRTLCPNIEPNFLWVNIRTNFQSLPYFWQ